MSGTRYRWIAWAFFALLAAWAGLSFDWRPARPVAPAAVVSRVHVRGPLRAGAGRADLVPPVPVALGGYSTRGDEPYTEVLDRPGARALALEAGGRTLVLVSAELVLVPPDLREAVVAKLAGGAPDVLHIAATHTHSGLGGYWDHPVASVGGLGSYDPHVREHLVAQLAAAVRGALETRRPARLAAASIEASAWAANRRREGGAVDRTMTAAIVRDDAGVIGRLVVLAAHPTILPRDGRALSGDWPGWMMAALEAEGGGVALFFQGAVGDTTWAKRQGSMDERERVRRFGRAVAADARGALAAGGEGEAEVELAAAEAEVALPPADAGGLLAWPFRAAGSNLLQWILGPQKARLSYVQVGPLRLALVPGEVTGELGLAWGARLGAPIVSVADGYLGYVESPEKVRAGEGESRGVWFGPGLAPVLLDGLEAAKAAATAPAEPASPSGT